MTLQLQNYRERMRPRVSYAEIKLFHAIQKAGLNKGMTTQKPIVLQNEEGTLFQTIPDYYWHNQGVAVYLDGPHHLKLHVATRDEKIDAYLHAQKGIRSIRFSYKPPLTKKHCNQIVNELHATLGEE